MRPYNLVPTKRLVLLPAIGITVSYGASFYLFEYYLFRFLLDNKREEIP